MLDNFFNNLHTHKYFHLLKAQPNPIENSDFQFILQKNEIGAWQVKKFEYKEAHQDAYSVYTDPP